MQDVSSTRGKLCPYTRKACPSSVSNFSIGSSHKDENHVSLITTQRRFENHDGARAFLSYSGI